MQPSRPNIVLIVLDTQRADRLGCYGYARNTSPNLDAFAAKSTLFTRAISPAQWTIPSHASLFSGVYPAVHRTIQANDALSTEFPTLAEHLQEAGYQSAGFCNNPLVGVLNNGFRRGFDQFFNYGGTVPSTPDSAGNNNRSLFHKIQNQYYKLIDRIATPIQQAVAASPQVMQVALNPWLVPLWTRYANFKGDTAASIHDTHHFLGQRDARNQFIFLNLMGTHLPYAPPRRFIQKYAPVVIDEPEAQDFMSAYNSKALQWLLPLETPYPPIEHRTLSDMYDAEVAYQDHLLHPLLESLDRPEIRDNTLVIIVADHGEMLGEHQIMGHGLGVHEALVRVPLIVRFPGQTQGTRQDQAVSTTRIYHTILEAVGIEPHPPSNGIHGLIPDLQRTPQDPSYVFSEAYPPNNLIIIMEKYAPALIQRFNCRSTRWAVYNQPYKLIHTENLKDEIYHYIQDPQEDKNLVSKKDTRQKLRAELEGFLVAAANSQSGYLHTDTSNLDDEQVLQRLRNLGYIE